MFLKKTLLSGTKRSVKQTHVSFSIPPFLVNFRFDSARILSARNQVSIPFRIFFRAITCNGLRYETLRISKLKPITPLSSLLIDISFKFSTIHAMFYDRLLPHVIPQLSLKTIQIFQGHLYNQFLIFRRHSNQAIQIMAACWN